MGRADGNGKKRREYEGDGTPDGLVGLWKSKEKWSFEFTSEGTFKEDEYFPGHYSVDEGNKTFSLAYKIPTPLGPLNLCPLALSKSMFSSSTFIIS